jgi:hypothetical protein
MIKTIVVPQQANLNISIPKNYIGKKIEVLLYAVDEIEVNNPKANVTMADFWGIISDETAQKLHQNVGELRKEWERDI